MLRTLLAVISIAGLLAAQSRDPVVRDVVVHNEADAARVELSIAWPNAWHHERNHDAAWLVLRGDDPTRGPLRLAVTGHAVLAGAVPATMVVSEDQLGVFIAPNAAQRGDVAWTVSLRLDEAAPKEVTAWTLGMVNVPGGPFEAGDDDALARAFGAFYATDSDGAPRGTVHIDSEAALAVQAAPGGLWYETNEYRGDQRGPIPADWPKGTRAFYVMKHELRQGQYAAFLNALPPAAQEQRAPLDLTGEETETCTIARVDGRFAATAAERPCNFVSWDDTCAFLDWFALRPMTELEFEKAARGPTRPMPLDYPWGTASTERLERQVQRSRDLTAATADAERGLDDATKARLGASFYWVMDLAGSVWERVISAGHQTGRDFRGSHGDGVLDAEGRATNDDWPRGGADGKSAPGIGYRGGAEYFAPRRPNDPTNPQSPVAVRTYAAWDGAYRSPTYSARGCRTAPVPRGP